MRFSSGALMMIRICGRALSVFSLALLLGSVVVPMAQGGALTLRSPAFTAGGAMPKRFSCHGVGISPPLSWSGVPAGAKSMALIVEDPDAPSGLWVHWLIYNLPTNVSSLDEDAGRNELPANTHTGSNSYGQRQYGAVCPPSGVHHYHFRLYALDIRLPVRDYDRQGLRQAMRGHVMAGTLLVGLYEKQ